MQICDHNNARIDLIIEGLLKTGERWSLFEARQENCDVLEGESVRLSGEGDSATLSGFV